MSDPIARERASRMRSLEAPLLDDVQRRARVFGLTALSRISGLHAWAESHAARREAQETLAWNLFNMAAATDNYRHGVQIVDDYARLAMAMSEFRMVDHLSTLPPGTLSDLRAQMHTASVAAMKRSIHDRLPALRRAALTVLPDDAARQDAHVLIVDVRDALLSEFTPDAVDQMRQVVTDSRQMPHTPELLCPSIFSATLSIAGDPEQYGFASTTDALESCLGAVGLHGEGLDVVRDYMQAGIEAYGASAQMHEAGQV